MARILRRSRAQRDLDAIWDYVAERDGEPRADGVLRRIYRTLALLADHPLMGRSRDELRPGLRSSPAHAYVVFYLPLDDGIDVVRVLYGGRDIPAALDEEDAKD